MNGATFSGKGQEGSIRCGAACSHETHRSDAQIYGSSIIPDDHIYGSGLNGPLNPCASMAAIYGGDLCR